MPLQEPTIPTDSLETPAAPVFSEDSLVNLIARSIDDDKGEDICIIDLAGKTSIADAMVIASGRSSRQVSAMADHISEKLKKLGIVAPIEGQTSGDWVLVDAGDVLVHLFRPEVRAFYNLEKMWGGPTVAEGTPLPSPSSDGDRYSPVES